MEHINVKHNADGSLTLTPFTKYNLIYKPANIVVKEANIKPENINKYEAKLKE